MPESKLEDAGFYTRDQWEYLTRYKGYVFSNQASGGHGDVGSARWDRIQAARRDMHSALYGVLTRIRKDYLEIDIDETDKTAWETYRTEMAEIDG